jgi:hypothetical protein
MGECCPCWSWCGLGTIPLPDGVAELGCLVGVSPSADGADQGTGGSITLGLER